MNGILIDTNGYSAFVRGDLEALDLVHRAPIVAINPVVLGELQAGISLGTKPAENRLRLASFLNRPGVVKQNLDESTADVYASIAVALRRTGQPIPTNDIWIAASALQHGLDLFSYDAHFQLVPGLRVGTSLAHFS